MTFTDRCRMAYVVNNKISYFRVIVDIAITVVTVWLIVQGVAAFIC